MRGVLLLATQLGACGSDNVVGPKGVKDLAGTWAVTRWELINTLDAMQRVSVLPAGDGALLEISPVGSFTFTIASLSLGVIVVQRGTLTIHGDTLTYTVTTTTVTPAFGAAAGTGTLAVRGDQSTYDAEANEVLFVVELTGAVMSWRALEPTLIDINDDGVPDQTVEELAFARS